MSATYNRRTPLVGFCPHGGEYGLCDRDACDEGLENEIEYLAPPTDKQVRYVKVLLRKHEVPTGILNYVNIALSSKKATSELITELQALPLKGNQ